MPRYGRFRCGPRRDGNACWQRVSERLRRSELNKGIGVDLDGIASQIAETQAAANQAAATIASIGETVGNVNEISSAISAAVGRQAAVAQEMSANKQAMTKAVSEISRNVSLIAASTQEVDASMRLVRDASRAMVA
ncbi:hypothetical protein [Methylobacterium aerolatum]|uniref:Methyl-accepting chemotaxis protein n=1 Tax=Methylobacterium aerolatum TaxID=418708 RepID=A0ABU0HWZ5_9HYPH|nr:hypothetical protein [Methylobacterium aerolatum]MDQ0446859.1 methyl-accepting chemotaxis protein [Methylobacterium aerolatum]GJD33824.1 hypothetical protein FMGBMHLM_0719 [Methylobacterium aerolatum]